MKVYNDRFEKHYMNRKYGKVVYQSVKKPIPKLVKYKYNPEKVISYDENNPMRTLYVTEYDYYNDEPIINYIISAYSDFYNDNDFCIFINSLVDDINMVVELLVDYCDCEISVKGTSVLFIVTKTCLLMKMDTFIVDCKYPMFAIPIKTSEVEIFQIISKSDLNLISNRYMVEFLIDYLTYFKGRLEYYEQEIAKSKN